MANIFGGTPAFDAECRTSYAVAQITGDRFVSVAMEINREAEQIAAGKAREAGAYEVTDNYERGTSMREAKAKEYQQKEMKHYMADRTALMDCIWRDGV